MALVVSEVVMSAMGALVDMVDMVVMVDAEVTMVMATMVTDFFFSASLSSGSNDIS